jgi:RNA-binding protein Nova
LNVAGITKQEADALLLLPVLLQLSLHEQFASYMESTLQLATNQGVVLPPRSSAAKNVLAQVRRRAVCTQCLL